MCLLRIRWHWHQCRGRIQPCLKPAHHIRGHCRRTSRPWIHASWTEEPHARESGGGDLRPDLDIVNGTLLASRADTSGSILRIVTATCRSLPPALVKIAKTFVRNLCELAMRVAEEDACEMYYAGAQITAGGAHVRLRVPCSGRPSFGSGLGNCIR